MTSATQTIETRDVFILNCLSDDDFSNYIDFDTDLLDLTPADMELSFEDMCLPIQDANEELPAESQLADACLTDLNRGIAALTAEKPLKPLVETDVENVTDKAVCKPKSAGKADCPIEV